MSVPAISQPLFETFWVEASGLSQVRSIACRVYIGIVNEVVFNDVVTLSPP